MADKQRQLWAIRAAKAALEAEAAEPPDPEGLCHANSLGNPQLQADAYFATRA